jgi:hypothetical protein
MNKYLEALRLQFYMTNKLVEKEDFDFLLKVLESYGLEIKTEIQDKIISKCNEIEDNAVKRVLILSDYHDIDIERTKLETAFKFLDIKL